MVGTEIFRKRDKVLLIVAIFIPVLLLSGGTLSALGHLGEEGFPTSRHRYSEVRYSDPNVSRKVGVEKSRYGSRFVEDFKDWEDIDRSNTTASVRTMEEKVFLWGSSPVIPPTYEGQMNLNTHSHGGGYSPKYDEYWYPSWSGRTVYRYDKNGQYKGTFSSGQRQMMQLWGDKDGTYYTANWGYDRVYKWSDKGNNQIWSYHLGSTAGGVCADEKYVYAMRYYDTRVYILRKDNGHKVRDYRINGGNARMYGSLAVANGYLYVGGYNRDYRRVGIFKASDGTYVGDFRTNDNIYNMAFNGEEYCISRNRNTVHKYRISDGNSYLGDDIEPPTNITNIQSKGLYEGDDPIGAARLTWFGYTPEGTALIFNVSVDGKHWTTMENNTNHVFEHQGKSLFWNATIKTDDKDISPYIDKVIIDYDLVGSPVPSGPSSTVWHGTPTPTLEWNFTDPDKVDHQSDFILEIFNDTLMDIKVYNSTWINSSDTVHTPETGLEDGIYYWRVRTKDAYHAAGGYSGLKRIKIDTTPPFGSIVIADGGESVNEQLVYLSLESNDNASGMDVMQIINDRGSAQEWEPFKDKKRVALSPTDGLKTLGIRFRDKAGIASEVFEDSVYLDLKGPANIEVMSPTHPNPERYYKSTSPIFEWEKPYEVTEIKGYNYLVDASPMSEPYKDFTNPEPPSKLRTETGEFSGLKDGTWYFHITACDIYNQWSNTSHFQFNIDSAEPVIRETFPEAKWHSETVVAAGAVFEDVGGFGLDVDSIRYSVKEQGEEDFGMWIDEGVKTEVLTRGTSDNPLKVRTAVQLELPEGDGNAVKWQITDLSGNGPMESEPLEIRIDTTPVIFSEAVPKADVVNVDPVVACGITVRDDGSGVEGSTVEFAVSEQGDDERYFKRWTKVNYGRRDKTVKVRMDIEFEAGRNNYIRWRATDAVGNGPVMSDPFRVWVNSPPKPIISRPSDDGVYEAGAEIALSARGTEDGEDDELHYWWAIKNRTTKRVVGTVSAEEGIVTLERPGNYLVYLYVDDGFGFNESDKVDIFVKGVKTAGQPSKPEGAGIEKGSGSKSLLMEWWWLIAATSGLLLILLIVPLIIIKIKQKKKSEPQKVGFSKGRYSRNQSDFYRPGSPYPSQQYLSGARSSLAGGFGAGSRQGPGAPGASPGIGGHLPSSTGFSGTGALIAQQPGPGVALPPSSAAPWQTPTQQSTPPGTSYLLPASTGEVQTGAASPIRSDVARLPPATGAVEARKTPAYSLPTFETDKGAQNLARAALPPAPDEVQAESGVVASEENASVPGTGQPEVPSELRPGAPETTPISAAADTASPGKAITTAPSPETAAIPTAGPHPPSTLPSEPAITPSSGSGPTPSGPSSAPSSVTPQVNSVSPPAPESTPSPGGTPLPLPSPSESSEGEDKETPQDPPSA